MRSLIKPLFFLFIIVTPYVVDALESTGDFKGVWAGVEVMGCDRSTANAIRTLIPIQAGASFNSLDMQELRSWCDVVRNEFRDKEIKCSFIGYIESSYYFNVEIIPPEFKQKQFRKIRTVKAPPTIPQNLIELHDEFEMSFMKAFQAAHDPQENYDRGYTDFQDPILHAISEKLSKLAYRHNKIILNVIRYSKDPIQRSKAATLLSWTKKPNNLKYILEWDLLNDSDSTVRNNLARSVSSDLDLIKDKILLNKAIRVFCRQATFPSHSDRNKALVSLKSIIEKHPDLIVDLDNQCLATLTYISENSILINSGGVAKEILDMTQGINHV